MASLQQGLELPGPGPPLPVPRRGRDGPHEHAGASFRTEVGIDPERTRSDRDDSAGERGIDLAGIGGNEEDVDVARVVELFRTVLAHGDDGEPAVRPGKADGARQHPVGDKRNELVTSSRSVSPSRSSPATSNRERCLRRTRSSTSSAGGRVPAQRTGIGDAVGASRLTGPEHLERGRVGDEHAGKDRLATATTQNLAARAGSDSSCPRASGKAAKSWSATSLTEPGAADRADEVVEQAGRRHKPGVLCRQASARRRPDLRVLTVPNAATVGLRVGNLRLALCQLDVIVGDLEGNADKVTSQLAQAEAAGASLAVFPELVLTGYPRKTSCSSRALSRATSSPSRKLRPRQAVARPSSASWKRTAIFTTPPPSAQAGKC